MFVEMLHQPALVLSVMKPDIFLSDLRHTQEVYKPLTNRLLLQLMDNTHNLQPRVEHFL